LVFVVLRWSHVLFPFGNFIARFFCGFNGFEDFVAVLIILFDFSFCLFFGICSLLFQFADGFFLGNARNRNAAEQDREKEKNQGFFEG